MASPSAASFAYLIEIYVQGDAVEGGAADALVERIFILTTRDLPSAQVQNLVVDCVAAANNMLVQASALAEAIGQTKEHMTLKFKTAVASRRERIDGRSVV